MSMELFVSAVIAGVVIILALLLHDTRKTLNRTSDCLANLALTVAKVEGMVAELEQGCGVCQETVKGLTEKVSKAEVENAEAAKQLKLWNEGLENIVNYSVDTAKGDKR